MILPVTAILVTLLGQTLVGAEKLCEESKYAECLKVLDGVERRSGVSPRSLSMRIIANQEADPLWAHRAVLQYLAMTRGHALGDNPAHRDMLERERTLRKLLEAKLEAERQALVGSAPIDTERQQAAEEAKITSDLQRRESALRARRRAAILRDAASAARSRK
ncbi:MAG: hypothetical protein M3Y59_09370 [Myxococcota bacterium]|nr:hypothetical protein [Myxococcota bacterium]